MSKEKLEIKKGGKLIETRWVYDDKNDVGEYKQFDVSNNSIRHLFSICEIEEGATLKDIFLLLNKNIDFYDILIGNWCKEIVTEGLTKKPKKYIEDDEAIEYLELYYTPEYDDDMLYGFKRPDFHGVGFARQKEKEEHGFKYKIGDRTPWGVSFTPANKLINIPVKLNNKIEIYSEYKVINEFNNPEYTLLDIFYGIIWELSFHGSPKKRNKQKKELDDIIKDIRK